MQRAVTLKAGEEFKRSATKEQSDWSNGGVTEENMFLSLPLTASLIIEQLVSGMSDKAGISDSFSEELGFRGESSKSMYSPPTLEFAEGVLMEQLNGCQLQFPSMAEKKQQNLRTMQKLLTQMATD